MVKGGEGGEEREGGREERDVAGGRKEGREEGREGGEGGTIITYHIIVLILCHRYMAHP